LHWKCKICPTKTLWLRIERRLVQQKMKPLPIWGKGSKDQKKRRTEAKAIPQAEPICSASIPRHKPPSHSPKRRKPTEDLMAEKKRETSSKRRYEQELLGQEKGNGGPSVAYPKTVKGTRRLQNEGERKKKPVRSRSRAANVKTIGIAGRGPNSKMKPINSHPTGNSQLQPLVQGQGACLNGSIAAQTRCRLKRTDNAILQKKRKTREGNNGSSEKVLSLRESDRFTFPRKRPIWEKKKKAEKKENRA